MFSNKKLAKAFEYAVSRKSGDGDVWDGSMMRDIPMSQRLCVLEFSVSSDGTGFFARGNQSWGPVTAVCLNLEKPREDQPASGKLQSRISTNF